MTQHENGSSLMLAVAGIMSAFLGVLYLLSRSSMISAVSSLTVVLVIVFAVGGGVSLLSPSRKQKFVHLLLILCVLSGAVIIGGWNPDLITGRLFCGAAAGFVLLCSFTVGLKLADMLLGDIQIHAAERSVFAVALGLLALSFLTLAAGLCSILNSYAAWAILIFFLTTGAGKAFALLRDLYRAVSDAGAEAGFTEWAFVIFSCAVVILFLFPVFLPPIDYDVVEYHLQLPREYYDMGCISYLPHNAFSAFPQNTEMLWLFSFMLGGGSGAGPDTAWGVWIAKLINFSFLPMFLVAAFLCVRRLTEGYGKYSVTGGLLAVLLLLGTEQTFFGSMKLYTELAMAFYAMTALLAVLVLWKTEGASVLLRLSLLAGVLAGGAAGMKYVGLVFIAFPVFLLVLFSPRKLDKDLRVKCALAAGFASWLVLSPWLIKNFVSTGNPFNPIWNSAFSASDWSEEQGRRFEIEHSAERHGGFSQGELARRAWQIFVGTPAEIDGQESPVSSLGLLALICLPLALFGPWKGNVVRNGLLALWPLGCFAAWYLLTNRADRFIFPSHAVFAVLSGAGVASVLHDGGRIGSVIGKGMLAVAGFAVCASVTLLLLVNLFSPIESQRELEAGANPTPVYRIMNGSVPASYYLSKAYSPWPLRKWMKSEFSGGRVVLVGSADVFWLPSDIYYSVVFSKHEFFDLLHKSANADALAASLKGRGVTHVFINWPELARLHSTYYKAYDLDDKEQKVLREFLIRNCSPVGMRDVPPWSISHAAKGNGWIATFMRDYSVMFPYGRDGDYYTRYSRELYHLR
ncbi:MAG: hypothetical protein JXR97_15160 [Planctomycetes bacterium]|nr:hypothetical protein [Planctomycetota bacterium]